MWVIVVDPPLQSTEVIGPFDARDEAAAWEDRHLDAPQGSRATFVEVVPPSEYVGTEYMGTVVDVTADGSSVVKPVE